MVEWCSIYYFLNCNDVSFDTFENKEDTNENSILEDVKSGENENYMFKFVDASSFVTVFSSNLNEPVSFINVEEKCIAESQLKDQYGQVVFDDEPPIGKHFQKFRSKNKFKLLPYAVYIKPDEVYQPFVEVDQNLTLRKRL